MVTIMVNFVLQGHASMRAVMHYDGYRTSQPLFLEGIEHHDELYKAFSFISYIKVSKRINT